MVLTDREDYPPWVKSPDESYAEFKRRFGKFHKKTLRKEYIREESKIFKAAKTYRAWEQMPGESPKDFRRRLRAEKDTTIYKL